MEGGARGLVGGWGVHAPACMLLMEGGGRLCSRSSSANVFSQSIKKMYGKCTDSCALSAAFKNI